MLPTGAYEWLLAQATRLRHAYETTSTPLGHGLIHADVQPDNLLHEGGRRWLLIDGDTASYGPRELDLAFAVPSHFHDPDTARAQFSVVYGYDITTWTGGTLIPPPGSAGRCHSRA